MWGGFRGGKKSFRCRGNGKKKDSVLIPTCKKLTPTDQGGKAPRRPPNPRKRLPLRGRTLDTVKGTPHFSPDARRGTIEEEGGKGALSRACLRENPHSKKKERPFSVTMGGRRPWRLQKGKKPEGEKGSRLLTPDWTRLKEKNLAKGGRKGIVLWQKDPACVLVKRRPNKRKWSGEGVSFSFFSEKGEGEEDREENT